ncbi:MAG: hypothetical protein JKY43_07750 [Phycisphaerales bacterium]|nr:hypothetical protein [Phycisphaerales bacterium]
MKHARVGIVPVGNQGHPGSISEATPYVWGHQNAVTAFGGWVVTHAEGDRCRIHQLSSACGHAGGGHHRRPGTMEVPIGNGHQKPNADNRDGAVSYAGFM